MKSCRKSARRVRTSSAMRPSGTFTRICRPARLPNVSKAVDFTSAKSMSTRGPRLNPPPPPGSLAMTPRIVNVARPIVIWSPTLRPSVVRSSGRTSAPRFSRSACEYGLAILERQRAVKRERRLHSSQLDHLRNHPPIRGPRHRRRLERLGACGCACFGEPAINCLTGVGRPIAIRANHDVARRQRARFARDHVTDALNDRAQGDDRRNADGDAHKEKQQAAPRRARFAQRHPKHELHVCSTTRPSRSESRPPASEASSVSCVTRTTVVPRR